MPIKIYIEIFGESKTISQWGNDSRCKVHINTFRQRLRSGMNPEKALKCLDWDDSRNFEIEKKFNHQPVLLLMGNPSKNSLKIVGVKSVQKHCTKD